MGVKYKGSHSMVSGSLASQPHITSFHAMWDWLVRLGEWMEFRLIVMCEKEELTSSVPGLQIESLS